MFRKAAVRVEWRIWLALVWSLGWFLSQQYLLYTEREALLVNLPRVADHWGRLPPGALSAIGLYALMMLGLYSLFAFLNVAAFRLLLAPRLEARTQVLALLAQLILATLVAQLGASWLTPYSVSGDLLLIVLHSVSGRVIFAGLALLLALYFSTFLVLYSTGSRRRKVVIVAVLASSGLALSWGAHNERKALAEDARPDVIVIGVDSLRPDHLKRFGAPFEVMPNLERFLDGARVYSDVLSPQPHTFPSTVSILTGQWPVTNGARGNLFPVDRIDRIASVAHKFKADGYDTAFAMDETRFANIDQSYGFDYLFSPGMGSREVLLSFVADNALLNVLAATPLMNWLLPDVYGNRALSALYRPAAFSARLTGGLRDVDPRKPLFLYVHFCAGHWPYMPAPPFDSDHLDLLLRGNYFDASSDYLRSLAAADVQFGTLLEDLRRQGRLNNAVVVALSDHGEDFNLSKDVLQGERGKLLDINVNGHGGSAYRSAQVSVLFAIRGYGATTLPPGTRGEPVSLVDVAPTLTHLVNLPAARPGEFDGVDVLGKPPSPERVRYVESSYFPNSLNSPKINEADVAGEVAGMYRITAAGRIEVKPSWIAYQLKYRQRAAYLGDWLVAFDQSPDGMPIVLKRSSRQWWPFADAPKEAPKDELIRRLCMHWQNDEVIGRRCSELVRHPGSEIVVTALSH